MRVLAKMRRYMVHLQFVEEQITEIERERRSKASEPDPSSAEVMTKPFGEL